MSKMRTFKLEKLVRDGIVADTESEGGIVNYDILSGTELLDAILAKLPEEVAEVRAAKSKEELVKEIGDIRDLLIAAARTAGIDELTYEPTNTFTEGHFVRTITLPEDNKWAQYYGADPERFPEVENND